VDARGNPVKNSNGYPLVKTPSLRVELLYTYLMTWYVMHCLSLMTTISDSEGFVPFSSDWKPQLVAALHILYPEDYFEWSQLPTG